MIDLESKAFDLDDLIASDEIKAEKQKTQNQKAQKKEKNIEPLPKENNNEKKIDINKEQKEKIIDTQQIQQQPIIDNRLVIGQNDKHSDLFISDSSRYLNTLILGAKGTGKTTSLLPFFAEQDISKKISGCTFIVSDKEMAYNLYSICKQYKRKVHLLKPSTDNEIANKFLWMTQYNYDYINEKIINYKDAIRKKEIVIIDMEVLKYRADAIRAVSMLLLQLRLDLQDTDITQRHSHFLYIDDAYYYVPFIDDLFRYGTAYNLGITIFLESRSQLQTSNGDYRNLVEDFVRNTIILNKISIEDYHYYKNIFNDKIFENIFNREKTSLIYQSVDRNGTIRNGIAKMKTVNTLDLNEVIKKSKKIRATLLKEKRKNRENELRSNMDGSNYSHEPKPIDDALLKAIAEDSEYVPNVSTEHVEEMEDKIREQIIEEEKKAKRKLAENIFNDYNSHIEFCDDLFKFS